MKIEDKSLKKTFINFMLPSVTAQWVFALYSMIDGMFVARGVSEIALAGVNIAMPFLAFLFSISLMFAVGTSTIIAIYFGKKQYEKASQIYTQNIVILAIISIIITVLVLFNLKNISYFLGATDVNIKYVMQYVGVIACFSGLFTIGYSFDILIKTDGRPKLATVIAITGTILNCILDWLLIIVYDYGVLGAALATGISQAILVVIYIILLTGKNATLKFCRFKLQINELYRTIKLGVPSGFTEMSAGIVIFIYNHAIITYLNEDALVSYTIVAYVNTIVVMTMAGIAQGFQPLVSYYYGKNQMDKCKKLLKYGLVSTVIFSFAFFIPTFFFAEEIVKVYISQEMEALIKYSTTVFRIFSISFLILGYNIIIGGYFTSIEKEKSAFMVAISRGLIFIILSLIILVYLFKGEGIWWSAILSEIMCLFLTLTLWKRTEKQQN